MVDKYKPLAIAPQTLTPPGRVIAIAWCLLCALGLVYAPDILRSAEAADHGLLAAALPAAGATAAAARTCGATPLRAALESPVQAVYSSPLMLGQHASPATDRQVSAGMYAGGPRLAAPAHINAAWRTSPPAVQVAQATAGKARPLRVLIVGASSIQESLGIELERRIEQYAGVTVLRFGRYSSGLARPDYYDWPKRLAELQAEFHPDLILAQWGGNDCQGISSQEGKFIAKFGTPEWDSAYAQRVAAIVGQMRQDGCNAVLIGMPAMRDRSFSNKIKRLDEVTQKACTAAGGLFLSMLELTTDAKGKFLDQVEFQGKKRLMRAGDGIHFSDHGAAYVADQLCLSLEQHFTFSAK